MKVLITAYGAVTPYTTKDGSIIRELMHPNAGGSKRQSLAEATIPVGGKTHAHCHHLTEELYHIITGNGELVLGADRVGVTVGDTVCIPPGMAHFIRNTGDHPLKIICCCCPPYSHDDTELLS